MKLLAIDQSTSATKALIFDAAGRPLASAARPHRQIYSPEGYISHDPAEIYDDLLSACAELSAACGEPACISITNQRETALIWNRRTGLPIADAVVWQCQRGDAICRRLSEHSEMIRRRTGLPLSPAFSAAKLAWLMENTPGAGEAARRGELLAGTMDSWLIWKLTGGRTHATDPTNACRTQLYNIHTLDWDEDIIELFGLSRNMLPELRSSDGVFGETDIAKILSGPTRICGVLGDSNAALLGHLCCSPGDAKVTYGTGSSLMTNIGGAPAAAASGLLCSVAWDIGGSVQYALDGNIAYTGWIMSWLRDALGLIDSLGDSCELARSAGSNGGVYLVPAFSGLGAPWWRADIRACISGMSARTGRAHIVRAGLEAIAYQINDVLCMMRGESGCGIKTLTAGGGGAANDFLMQFQADISGVELLRSAEPEPSALGAAFAGGIGLGLYSPGELCARRREGELFSPAADAARAEALIGGWKKAVAAALAGA